MPASEQTWRNQKVMHIIFGASAVVMTIATLWLLAKDHNREWKQWQLSNRKKAAWSIVAQRDALEDQYATKLASYDSEIAQAKSEPVDPALIDRFKTIVTNEISRLKAAEVRVSDADFRELDTLTQEVNKHATRAAELSKQLEAAENPDEQLERERNSAVVAAAGLRGELLDAMQSPFIAEALRREKEIAQKRKFVAADRTAAVSQLGLMVGEGASAEARSVVQDKIDSYADQIANLTEALAFANRYRTSLEAVKAEVDAARAAIVKEKSVMETELHRLTEQAAQTQPTGASLVGEWITRWPVLNALYSGNVRIDQIWLPDMTINYNFSQPARFDRCKSCHQDISATEPGTVADPAFPDLPESEREQTLAMQTPDDAPESTGDNAALVRELYGVVLTNDAIVGYETKTLVRYVLPESPAAIAGLESGDEIVSVGGPVGVGLNVTDKESVENYLLTQANWGEKVEIGINRGLDHPYTSHPRLDLYLTDSSPHPEKEMGCTICHDGQGSGTEFKWTSHTPSNSDQQADWAREYGWFDNHHWIFPMKPQQFVESNCLKCHFEKGSLMPSERFPEPPAPKLVEGWTLVEDYGCFGCHEINGFDGPDRRLGPDLRLEPNYSEVAVQMLNQSTLNDEERELAGTLVSRPDDSAARHRLLELIQKDSLLAGSSATSDQARHSPFTHKLSDGLKDAEIPGTYRKVGPSLRYLQSKVDFAWLYNWIKLPADFRPSTRMPQFFGQYEHLVEDPEELEETQRFEAVEIRALSEFLLANSSEFEYLTPPEGVTEPASAERGKWLFESRGCLACHSHEAFPTMHADQGPDLSRVGAKLASEKGQRWLYSWVKQPHRYHTRTKMPELFLDPIEEKDAQNQPTGRVTDPAADIAAFLLEGGTEWKPAVQAQSGWSPEESAALSELAVVWLASDTIPRARAEEYVRNGIPDSLEPKLKADEKLLLRKNFAGHESLQLQNFVARRTIGKYGCFGCHDIPGFEDAKTIGTGLADWGRKDSSRLAFENIHAYLAGPGDPHLDETAGSESAEVAAEEHALHEEEGHGGHLNPADYQADGISYYLQSLVSHSRDGFLWQKLRQPRSYDYKTTKNKTFNERLRMPRFPFTAEEREAVMTFVLGLVSEPPADKFVYNPSPRQAAIVEGHRVLERFNCAGCHTLRMEQWDVALDPEMLEEPIEVTDYPFLERLFTPQEVAESAAVDRRNRVHSKLVGLPVISEETGEPQLYDEDGLELEPDDDESDPYYRFTLWDDTLIGGMPWLMGIQDPMIPASRTQYGPAEGEAHPAWGGDLARYLYPRVIEHAQQTNPQVKGSEAWGWLPPPLMAEGKKVQPDWLHGFLMDPTALRPAVVMRMPNFHMSSAEAEALVDYFAAASEVEYPYEYNRSQRDSYLASLEVGHPHRLSDAMNIVVDGNYCVKCHAVSDFTPQGDVTTFGPNLANVHERLRPEYVRNWVANPKRILPYTGMPVNIPYNPDAENLGGVAQKLFPGTSLEQLRGLVDLLMNFGTYAKRQTEIAPLVKQGAPAGAEQNAEPAAEQTTLLRDTDSPLR